MASTSFDINVKVHGTGTPNADCGSYPNIYAKLTITFNRDPGSNIVTWSTSGMDRWACLPPTGSGRYGYPFYAYINVNGTYYPIISKSSISSTKKWETARYTTLATPSGSFTSTSDRVTVSVYAKKGTCKNKNTHFCYGEGSGYQILYSWNVSIPPYENTYTVSYNANGGAPKPDNQYKSSLYALTLTSQVPTNNVTIDYYNYDMSSIRDVDTVGRQFMYWLCSADSGHYSPGGNYNVNSDCTMTAIWGNATFTPIPMPNRYFTVIFNYNGGTGTPASKYLLRAKSGYSTASGSSVVSYRPGVSGTTSTNLSLYPVYGNATLTLADLPTPTRTGFVFGGWYLNAALTNKITSSVAITKDTVVYAKWNALPIHIFKPNGTWSTEGGYVWKCVEENGSKVWKKIAPIYKFESGDWINISGD